jgi:two-component system, OmpR family, sensor histidine kinase MtrB
MFRGVRGRLTITIIGLVALTSLVLGVGAYAYVATSLRDQQVQAARDLTNFNVSVLAAERVPSGTSRDDPRWKSLLDAFTLRGVSGTVIDFGDNDPFASGLEVTGDFRELSPALRSIIAGGNIGFERLAVDGRPLLVTGARRPPDGPTFYFFFDASEVEGAIQRLGQTLAVGGLILVALAAVAARSVARRLLDPVRGASAAAERIAGGDLSARLGVASGDEFGRWAASFNRMATSLERTVGELQAAEARERRFVADVSHELRTPLTALINEAALLKEHLDSLPPGGRRVGELLVADIARLRTLVDDLMDISRFDAAAEQLQATEFELQAFIRAVVQAHAPGAVVSIGHDGGQISADRRRLERVIGNLLDNARVHGEGKAIEVEANLEDRESGPELVVAVLDRGPGVSPDELPLLFERFHKADPSRHLGGSGLGLAIARENARLLGGDVGATSRQGGGMRLEMRVPVTRSLPAGDGTVTAEAQAGEEFEHRTEPRT